ncbi:zinc finger (ccch type) domain-containing protein [Cyclospora cayetanensis]|uniref:Zinc finger (Ccch type) domain-containing protein n=1 Tax=Cyclospora cayetanensis TaxID=88456 RepID=A0A1D3D9J7_9EIME|nr:zinc finger (ccch type) domain-containing protein [Cyclospora cayetanensis]
MRLLRLLCAQEWMGELGDDGLFRNKVWTKDSQAAASTAAAGASAVSEQQNAAVAALSFTLPSTPPSLKRGQPAPQQQDFSSLALPPAADVSPAAPATAATDSAVPLATGEGGDVEMDGDAPDAAPMAEDVAPSA